MSVSSLMEEKRLRKYRKALDDAGWVLRTNVRGASSTDHTFDGPVFYLCDLETGQLHVVTAIKGVFDLAQEHMRKRGFEFQEMCNTFGSLYGDICNGKVLLDTEASNLLALAVAAYISGTEGYRVVLQNGIPEQHYLIIRQWDYAAKTPLLRPVPISAKSYYAPDEIEALVDEILAIDRERHPERFQSAEVLPFVVRQRTDV